MTNDKIIIPFKDYNAMRASHIILWITFVFVAIITMIIVSMLCLIGSWIPSASIGAINVAPFALLCVSLLFLHKYRVIFFTASFYLFAVYYILSILSSGVSFTHTPADISLVFLLLTMLASLIMAAFLTLRTRCKQNLSFAKWIAVAYVFFRIASTVGIITVVLSNLSPGLPDATPQYISIFIIQNLIGALPELLFAYFGYKAYSDAYYNYFIAQPFSRLIREHTIQFS